MKIATGAKVIACDPTAIEAADRPRYDKLVNRLRAAMRSREERSDGYAYYLDSATISLPEAAEWIELERRCCPFLTLELSASGSQEDWILTLTGPEGTKALLEVEFP